mgnify:CR=1 FL=1
MSKLLDISSNYFDSYFHPEKIRKVKFHDAEKDRILIFLTNNFELKAHEIALLYKQRWQVELFFKNQFESH